MSVVLVVHGGAGSPPEPERPERQAAVRHMEDEPLLNAGVGASYRAGGVAAVRDVRHPIDLARSVMEDRQYPPGRALQTALEHLQRQAGVTGGMVLLTRDGELATAHTTEHMAWAQRLG
jgi:isoaspartyl peptidase/L-asparaginase-like protein (Ntn-hydrolase superfamily)